MQPMAAGDWAGVAAGSLAALGVTCCVTLPNTALLGVSSAVSVPREV